MVTKTRPGFCRVCGGPLFSTDGTLLLCPKACIRMRLNNYGPGELERVQNIEELPEASSVPNHPRTYTITGREGYWAKAEGGKVRAWFQARVRWHVLTFAPTPLPKRRKDVVKELKAEIKALRAYFDRAPKAWRQAEGGLFVQDVPLSVGTRVYAIDPTGFAQCYNITGFCFYDDSSYPSQAYPVVDRLCDSPETAELIEANRDKPANGERIMEADQS